MVNGFVSGSKRKLCERIINGSRESKAIETGSRYMSNLNIYKNLLIPKKCIMELILLRRLYNFILNYFGNRDKK